MLPLEGLDIELLAPLT
jgi:hypothetical protein